MDTVFTVQAPLAWHSSKYNFLKVLCSVGVRSLGDDVTACSPARADLVAAVGETTGESALQRMLARMQATSSGRDILRDRPRITVSRCNHGAHASLLLSTEDTLQHHHGRAYMELKMPCRGTFRTSFA